MRRVVAVLLLAASACTPGDVVDVPMTLAGDDVASQALVHVWIRDEGPLLFAIDTGSSETVLDRRAAEDIGLRVIPGSEREVAGLAGEGRAYEVSVRRWRMGELELNPRRMVVVDIPQPDGGSRLDGLIGSNVLDDFAEMTIDYEDEELRLRL